MATISRILIALAVASIICGNALPQVQKPVPVNPKVVVPPIAPQPGGGNGDGGGGGLSDGEGFLILLGILLAVAALVGVFWLLLNVIDGTWVGWRDRHIRAKMQLTQEEQALAMAERDARLERENSVRPLFEKRIRELLVAKLPKHPSGGIDRLMKDLGPLSIPSDATPETFVAERTSLRFDSFQGPERGGLVRVTATNDNLLLATSEVRLEDYESE